MPSNFQVRFHNFLDCKLLQRGSAFLIHVLWSRKCLLLGVAVKQHLQVNQNLLQIRGMHTIIRDKNTSADNFVFYTDRLLRLVSKSH